MSSNIAPNCGADASATTLTAKVEENQLPCSAAAAADAALCAAGVLLRGIDHNHRQSDN